MSRSLEQYNYIKPIPFKLKKIFFLFQINSILWDLCLLKVIKVGLQERLEMKITDYKGFLWVHPTACYMYTVKAQPLLKSVCISVDILYSSFLNTWLF